jgi:DNA-binding NtrC family response regulator
MHARMRHRTHRAMGKGQERPVGKTAAESEWPAILVIDDDEDLGALIRDYLREERLLALFLQDSMVALRMLDEGLRVDLLLTDIAMTEGTPNGVSLALLARRRIPNLPVLFMTGYPDLLDEVENLPGKVFVKPFELAELTQEIRRNLTKLN